MLRQRQKSIGIAIAICSLFLFGMVNSSEAFEITESPSNSNTYIYGGWTYATFYVETSEPHFSVSWYIDGVHAYSSGDGTTTSASYCPTNTLSGDIKGVTYQISIEAWSTDGNTKDTATFQLTVYEPLTDWNQEPRSSVWCYSEISRHYYLPQMQEVRADYYAYAWNPLDKDEVGALFRDRIYILEYYLDVFGLGVADFARKTYDAETLQPQGWAGFKSHTNTVTVLPGTAGSKYDSDATVTHGINGNAPGDPNFLVSIGITNEIEFRRAR